MKKLLFCAAAVAALTLTSCGGNSTPDDFAKEKLSLAKEKTQVRIDLYEAGTKANDAEFHKKYSDALEKLEKEDADYKAAEERLKKAQEEYQKLQ